MESEYDGKQLQSEFENPGEISKYLKEAFQDVLKEMLEAEMDITLGYAKNDFRTRKPVIAAMDIHLRL